MALRDLNQRGVNSYIHISFEDESRKSKLHLPRDDIVGQGQSNFKH
jgi:hypothetical protein